MLDEIAESNPAARRACRICTGPVLDGCGCEGQMAQTGELGVALIRRERVRQIDVHSYTARHDDVHEAGNQLSEAARAYLWHAVTISQLGRVCQTPPPRWPWSEDQFRAGNELESLVKARALIAARIDQLARQNPELLD